MRPLELTISAFGSYKGTETIDFTQLGEKGVFLIFGPTGAGKSTIFDAISFALFGEASGDSRDSKMLRSEYADPTTKTFVKLKFEYNGKEYTVERNLEYVRDATKRTRQEDGTLVLGTTTAKADASLESDGLKTVSGTREVDKKIVEILGITHDQFTKIAMIPQGEFQKLLQADNDTKQEILRKVFKTERFNVIEDAVAKEVSVTSNRRKAESENIRRQLNTIKGEDSSNTYSDFKKSLESYQDASSQLEAMLEMVSKLNKEDNKLKNDAIAEIDVCKKESARLEELKGKVIINNGNKVQLADTEGKLKKDKDKLTGLEEDLQKNTERTGKVEEKKNARTKYNLELPKYSGYEDDMAKLKKLQESVNTAKTELNKNIIKRDKLSEEITALENESKALSNCDAEKLKTEQIGKDTKLTIDNLNELKSKITDAEKACRNWEREKESLKGLIRDKDDASNKYEQAYDLFLKSQAGILAQDLIEGMPCPVCGSTHHPAKAVLNAEAPTEESVKKLKTKYDVKSESARTKSEECTGLKASYEGKKQVAEDLIGKMSDALNGKGYDTLKVNDCFAIDSIVSDLEEKRALLRNTYKTLSGKCDRKKQIDDEELPAKNNELKDLTSKIEADTSKTDEAKAIAEETRLKSLRSELSFDNQEHAEKTIKKLNEEISGLEKEIEDAQTAFNTCKTEISNKTTLIDDLKMKIDETLESDLEKVKKDITDNTRKQESAEIRRDAAAIRLGINEPVLKDLRDSKKSYDDLCAELSWKENLRDTLKGNLTGKQKIELETFVQMSYFNRILFKASQRLRVMSNGQYELVREETAANLGSKTGLGINVMDNHSGKIRSVKSLSGGESFLASLALALGLSDETQSSAGGIKIDTMFVDEGFGSLSPDVLGLALKTLENLAESGTLIGLISHVESIKDRYRHIEVTKTVDGGSSIKIV